MATCEIRLRLAFGELGLPRWSSGDALGVPFLLVNGQITAVTRFRWVCSFCTESRGMGPEGALSDEFEKIHAGRRLVLEYPMFPGTTIQAVVLDSPDTLGVEFVLKCAAMLVPLGQEADWMYSSEGGQWQLLASASVIRLILLARIHGPDHADKKGKRAHRHNNDSNHPQEKRRSPTADMLNGYPRLPVTTSLNNDDEVVKRMIAPLVLALAPKVSFDTGVPSIPFVSYTDNVLQRVLVEEGMSPLTGLMRVEDVELETQNSDQEGGPYPIQEANYGGFPSLEESSRHSLQLPKQLTRSWRRRLIFRRMPNLIQTEVLLTLQPFDGKRRVLHKGRKSSDVGRPFLKHKSGQFEHINLECAVRQVDHSKLVHKYLPPIVAGFVLVAPCLDRCLMSGQGRAKVLSIGVGGGALPIFLQKHFRFQIQAIDLDVGVLQLARKHFGLKEDTHFQVTVGDGLAVVEDIAARAIQQGVVDNGLEQFWTACCHNAGCAVADESLQPSGPSSSQEIGLTQIAVHVHNEGFAVGDEFLQPPGPSFSHFSEREQSDNDPRVEVIILDVDVSDARLGLSSPPQSFLEPRFLLSARIALQRGGMLAVNVVPSGEKPFAGVITSLRAVFAEVYEIALEDDLNHVVFALPYPAVSNYHDLTDSHTVDQVKRVVGDQLVKLIRRLGSLPG